ncbi:hypothetical protein AEQ67_04370 [Pseudomonas sp. RIT-PI-q]|uniref:hypothetical protein n=1 Tax=Pseudomonas sp. RIT-PI-q TaxID=1690247 RepID=UPI0006CD3B4D|nr:hypothetical protein [Pseudomonas sp. RIT-PI-q]KPH01505.1 hypothetical protein AEQ67_04370 [Pseudomonas sp. RIT-PI-q]
MPFVSQTGIVDTARNRPDELSAVNPMNAQEKIRDATLAVARRAAGIKHITLDTLKENCF